MQHDVLGGTDRTRAGAEQARPGACHRDDAERGQGVVERDLHLRLVVGVEGHLRTPQQQGVEQLPARLTPAAAAVGHGLAAVVALAHHLHLRGGGVHLDAALLHHRLQQFPGGIGGQLQQALVHGGQRDFAALGQIFILRPFNRDTHLGLVPDLINLRLRLDLHLQTIRSPTHVDLGGAQPEGGFAQVHQGGGLHLADPPAHRQHRDKHVGGVVVLERHLDHRGLAGQRLDEALHHPFPLHRDQGGGLAEWHAHLEARALARLVVLLLGQQIHAVVVARLEPPLVLARHPHRAVGEGRVIVFILGAGMQDQLTGGAGFGLAQEQTLGVGLALAGLAHPFDLGDILVAVKPADEPLAVGVDGFLEQVHGHRLFRDGFAAEVQG